MIQEKSYVLVDSFESLRDMISHLKSGGDLVAFDTETDSLNPRSGRIIGLSVSCEVGKGYYLPTMVFEDGELRDFYIEGKLCHDIAKNVIEMLKTKKVIGHNLSFDVRFVWGFYKINLVHAIHADTILLVHTVQEEGAGYSVGKPFGLKEIAKSIQTEIGFDVESEANNEQLELKASIKINGGSTSSDNYEIYKADLTILARYAAADVDLTLRLYYHFMQRLKQEGLEKFFFEDEVMPLYKEVTIPMENRGVRLDMDLITDASTRIEKDLKKYHNLVMESLMKDERVKIWVVQKAVESFPPTNRGNFAQELAELENLPVPRSEKTQKLSLTKANLEKLEPSKTKDFLMTGDLSLLDEIKSLKTSLSLWKKENSERMFNIQSKDHMGQIAFSALGMKPISHTDKGKAQLDDDFIQSIADKYDWAKNLRIYNRLLKIKSTYIDRFLGRQENGKYYFYYKQHATVSGRYGSDAQQLPRPKEEGDDDPVVLEYNNMIRAFFIPYEGNVFIDCDYESLEPKVFSHVSNDEGLKDIFRNNWDFYSTIAIKTEKLDQYSPDKKAPNFLKKVAPALRNKAKAYSLGIPYGMSPYALGKTINVKSKEAEELVNGYLDGFPNLKKWMEESKEFVKENGYIKTQVGRIRHLPKVKNLYDRYGDNVLDYEFKKQMINAYGEEKAMNIIRDYKNGLNNSMNVQIQGLAASIVNRAAIAINREFRSKGIRGQVIAQIHDQLVMEVEESKAEEAAKIVQDRMENTTRLSIDLVAPPAICHNLRDGH